MSQIQKLKLTMIVAGALAIGACSTGNHPGAGNAPLWGSNSPPPQAQNNQAQVYNGYGVVQSIELVQQGSTTSTGVGNTGIGMGTIIGAVVGGLVGTQVGSGSGTTAATVLGAAGGGYAGYALENRNQQQQQGGGAVYRFNVRMDNGAQQTLMVNTNTDFRVGDRVQIENGVLRRY